MKRENVWANEGGTPGMLICKIERGSEAWNLLLEALNSEVPYLRVGATDGNLKVKIFEGIWTWPLDVHAQP